MFISVLTQTTLIVLVAGAAVLALRRASSAARHAIWTVALACLLLLPLIRTAAPRWSVAVPATAVPVAAAVAGDHAGSPSDPIAPVPQRFNLLLLWYAGVAAAAARLIIASVRLKRLQAHARALSLPVVEVPRNVRVLESDEIDVPITFGLLRHFILLPSAAAEWPMERLRLVLAHELAHVRRHDCLTQLVAEVACAIYWFQPLVWFVSSQLRKERERACDDAVLAQGTKSSDYAEHLLGVVRSMKTKGDPIPMAISVHSHDLQARLKAVLKPDADRRAASWRLIAAVAVAAACIVVPLATMRAQAPSATASIAGSITDPSSAVIPNAIVTATGLDTHNKEAAYAGADGSYSFQHIPPGRYLVEVRAPGFARLQKQVTIAADEPLRFDPVLDIGSISENIDVVAQKPASTSEPAAVAHRIRVGGNVQATKLTYRVPPAYPQHAKEAGIQGSVVLQAVIGTDGSLLSLKPVSLSADPELVQAARDAVSQWRYQPTLLNGKPVEVVTSVTVNFRLE